MLESSWNVRIEFEISNRNSCPYSFKIGRPLYCKRKNDEFEDILTGLYIGKVIRWSGDIPFYLSTVSQRPWILENLNTNEKPGSAGTARESDSTRPISLIFNHLVLLSIFPLAFMILAVWMKYAYH